MDSTYIDSDPPSGVCGVCGSGSKYRCSRCRLPYCSLKCYKVHNKAQSELCETRKRKREEKNEKDREMLSAEFFADSLGCACNKSIGSFAVCRSYILWSP